MDKFEKNMESIFGLAPKEETAIREAEKIVDEGMVMPTNESMENDLDLDYIESRDNLKSLIKKGNDAVDTLMQIAKDTEHPRAFEVLAALIKNTSDANEKLLLLQKNIRELKNITKRDNSNVNVNRAIFIGSTADLLKELKEIKNVNE